MRQPLKLAMRNDLRSPSPAGEQLPFGGFAERRETKLERKEIKMRKTRERLDYPEVVKSPRYGGRLYYFNWILPIVRK